MLADPSIWVVTVGAAVEMLIVAVEGASVSLESGLVGAVVEGMVVSVSVVPGAAVVCGDSTTGRKRKSRKRISSAPCRTAL